MDAVPDGDLLLSPSQVGCAASAIDISTKSLDSTQTNLGRQVILYVCRGLSVQPTVQAVGESGTSFSLNGRWIDSDFIAGTARSHALGSYTRLPDV